MGTRREIDRGPSSDYILLMSLLRKILGRRLASWEGKKQELGVVTGVLGLDALASIGYGPEAALAVLMPLGVPGLASMVFTRVNGRP